MNKDLMIIKGPGPEGRDWPSDFVPEAMGTAEEVRALISSVLQGVDWSEPRQGVLEDDVRILFSLPEEEPVTSVGLEVGTLGEPAEVLGRLCSAHGWRLFDLSSGEFIDDMQPGGVPPAQDQARAEPAYVFVPAPRWQRWGPYLLLCALLGLAVVLLFCMFRR